MQRSRRSSISIWLLSFVIVAGPFSLPFARAQVVGATISGTVHDPSGAAVVGAQVTVTNQETGAVRNLVSDSAGVYSAPSLPVGRYKVTIEKPGFSTRSETGINLVVGQSAVVDLSLSVGKLQQQISVTDVPLAINTTTQPTSGLVSARQVKELPLNGRSYDELITLNPASVNYTGERSGAVGTSNSSPGNMFSVAGHRPQDNLYLLNGIEYTGASEINVTPGGVSGELLGVDAVREFNVVSDTYGAEYGKRTGAQISIDTESGTNQLHGSAFEFLRNSALDARNYFDQGNIPIFQRNQFGGALGGPLVKNKLLLFGNYEGFRQNLGLSDVTLVPDNASRAAAVPDVQPLLDLWPAQNGPELGGGIAEAYSHPLQRIREDFGTTRLDYNISAADTAAAVYTIDDSAATTPTINPLSTDYETLREQVLSAQEEHVFSSSTLNTFRVGFSRASFYFTGETPIDVPGWVAGQPIGAVVVGGGTALNGASQISGAGTNAGSNLAVARNLFTVADHVYISRGRNQIEAGVWLQRIQSNSSLAQDQYGQASFGSLSAFLLGNVSTFTVVPSPTELGWRSLEGAGFVQDTVHLLPNLELRAGFRFESTDGWNEAQGRASNYIFDSQGVLETAPRVADSAFTKNRAKFLPEPRVGIAWQPKGNGNTVIHAGFGIYESLLDSLDYRLDQNAPFNTTQTLKNVAVSQLHFVPGAPPPAGSKVSPSGIQSDAYTPRSLSYSASFEQKLASDTSLILGYIGYHGSHQMLSEDVNEPIPTICPASPCPDTLPPGTVYYPANAPNANPQLGASTTWVSDGISNYNALTVDLNRHFQHGFQVRGVYTWSKSLDDGTAWNSSVGANAPGFVMYPNDPKLDYGRANTDIRNVAVINSTYELPIGRGKRFLANAHGWQQKAFGGWTASEIATLQSGFPFTPQLGFNPTNNGDSRDPIRPSVNPEFRGNVIQGGPKQYFNPTAFLVPFPGTYGNVRRNTLTGPGIAELDLSLRKNTALTKKLNLQFRAEFFNILNRTNFGTPNTVVYASDTTTPSPTAGLITTTSTTSRQIQFGAKLLF
ncbi:MAG: carboxypeptidase-like regulatory domain-containing protein [Acidobacteriaceae bacterium]